MSGENSRLIAECIRKLAGFDSLRDAKFFVGTVTAVNTDSGSDGYQRECDVEGVLGGETITYEGVHLSFDRADGIIQLPAVDSTVFCALLPDGEVYVMAFTDVTKVICFIDSSNKFEFDSTGFIWNGGTLGGMTKTLVLKTELDKMNAQLQAVITVLTTWAVTGGDGGAALKAAAIAAIVTAGLAPGTFTGIEDTKIKH